MNAFVLPFVPPAVTSGHTQKTTRVLVRLTLVILSGVLLLGVARAEAGMITWHWAGPVTGYAGCIPGVTAPVCGVTLDTVVPLGTTIDLFVSIDPLLPPPDPGRPCYRGTASASFQVVGQTYTGTGHVWDEAHGFGSGLCVPGLNMVEIVVPFWGMSGPALPGGWVPFPIPALSGLAWAGDLTMIQPPSIGAQFPSFYRDMQAAPQRFTANLQAVPADMHPVPEPATVTLFGAGLAAAWAARRRRRRGPHDADFASWGGRRG
jgi:hypothetical protein